MPSAIHSHTARRENNEIPEQEKRGCVGPHEAQWERSYRRRPSLPQTVWNDTGISPRQESSSRLQTVWRYGAATMPPSPGKRYIDFEVLETDNAVIISDTELPDHSAPYIRLALLKAMSENIKTLIIAGDVVATDMAALNSFSPKFTEPGELTYRQVIHLLRDTLNAMLGWFEHVYIIEGNHDDRVARKTGGEIDLGMFIDHIPSVTYSRYPYLYVRRSNGELVKIIHPGNYSQDPAKLAQDFYNIEAGPYFDPMRRRETFQKADIVVAHCHRGQTSMSPDGAHQCIALGTLRDPTRTRYKTKAQAKKNKQWDASFATLEDGWLKHYPIAATHWARDLGPLWEEAPRCHRARRPPKPFGILNRMIPEGQCRRGHNPLPWPHRTSEYKEQHPWERNATPRPHRGHCWRVCPRVFEKLPPTECAAKECIDDRL